MRPSPSCEPCSPGWRTSTAERVYADSYGDEWCDYGELLQLITRRPPWHADASCREHPEVSWFPEPYDSGRAAKAICGRCLVLAECRSWALEQGPDFDGIFGGLSKSARAKLRRERKAA